MGLTQWLRKLFGRSEAGARPEISTTPQIAVQRDRDELTTFMTPPPVAPAVEPTVAVAVDATALDSADPEREATTVVAFEPEPDEIETDATVVDQPLDWESDSHPDVSDGGFESQPVSPLDFARADAEPEASAPIPSGADPEATLAMQIPPELQDAPDPEATMLAEAPRPVVARLSVVKGELEGEQYDLRSGENRLGRSPDSDVVLPSMWISRTHAIIHCEADRIVVSSQSDKITSVEGEAVTDSAELTDGSTLQLGGTIFRVEVLQ